MKILITFTNVIWKEKFYKEKKERNKMAKYCVKCGNLLEEGVKFCPKCGTAISDTESVHQTETVNLTSSSNSKSKVAAGLFGIFLGTFGVHNFYLGYTGKAVAQLLLTLVGWILCGIGPVVAAIWGFVEGVLILCGSINKDANGNPLND